MVEVGCRSEGDRRIESTHFDDGERLERKPGPAPRSHGACHIVGA